MKRDLYVYQETFEYEKRNIHEMRPIHTNAESAGNTASHDLVAGFM